MATGEKTYTKGGYERAPTKQLVCEWVKQAWKRLPTDLIKGSFRSCGVTVSVDGVEDDVITCMKEGKEAFPAKPLILTQTQQLLKDDQEGDTDPFADLDEEDPEDDYADVEIVSNIEEPKLDLQLSEDSDGDEELLGFD